MCISDGVGRDAGSEDVELSGENERTVQPVGEHSGKRQGHGVRCSELRKVFSYRRAVDLKLTTIF